MISKIYSAVIRGIDAVPVTIETDIKHGLPGLTITGLADATVKEAAVRVRAAVINSGFEFPRGRISINIAPAGIRKSGSALDLGIAIGIMAASGQVVTSGLRDMLFAGELSMDGTIVKTPGILNITEEAARTGKNAYIPYGNKTEASLVGNVTIFPVMSLSELIDHLNGKGRIVPISESMTGEMEFLPEKRDREGAPDFSDVKGQEAAKRALTVAAAGGHCVLMTGSPASGKTMLAERMPGIMPEMTYEEIVRTTEVYSAAGLLTDSMPLVTERPFRRPHHTVTRAGLIGGGIYPRPGEITLASGGILFMDEFAEVDPGVADALREPLERKEINMIREGETYTFPSDFLLIAASNPCRCGYYGDPDHECTCTPGEIMRYRMKLSGPILDRIDIHLELKGVSYSDLENKKGLSTEEMREMVARARALEEARFRGTGIRLNSEMTDRMAAELAAPDQDGSLLLKDAYETLHLNPRTLSRTIRIARTIADINGKEEAGAMEVAEALQYSRFDKMKRRSDGYEEDQYR